MPLSPLLEDPREDRPKRLGMPAEFRRAGEEAGLCSLDTGPHLAFRLDGNP